MNPRMRNDWDRRQTAGVGQLPARKVISAPTSAIASIGAVYMTYQWWVGACNELTKDNLDPISKRRKPNTVR